MKPTIVSLIVLYLLCFSAEDDNIEKNYYACYNLNPKDANDCYNFKITDDYTCCFVTNGNPSNGLSVKKCAPIENDAKSNDLNTYATDLYNNAYETEIGKMITANTTEQDLINKFGQYELTCNDQTGKATVDPKYFLCNKHNATASPTCNSIEVKEGKCCLVYKDEKNKSCKLYSNDTLKNLKNNMQVFYEDQSTPRKTELDYKMYGFSDDYIKDVIKAKFEMTNYYTVDCGEENNVTIDTYVGWNCSTETSTKTATKSHSLSTKFCPLLFIALLLLIV